MPYHIFMTLSLIIIALINSINNEEKKLGRKAEMELGEEGIENVEIKETTRLRELLRQYGKRATFES